MTPEQQKHYDEQLAIIRQGGAIHEAFIVNKIWGMGSSNLGPVEPAAIGFCNENDLYSIQYFNNWDEVNALINHIRETAVKAWGEQENPSPYVTTYIASLVSYPFTLPIETKEE